jgi:hypothetical protein
MLGKRTRVGVVTLHPIGCFFQNQIHFIFPRLISHHQKSTFLDYSPPTSQFVVIISGGEMKQSQMLWGFRREQSFSSQ